MQTVNDKSSLTPAASSRDAVLAVRGLGKTYRIYDHPWHRVSQFLFNRLGSRYRRIVGSISGGLG